MAFVITVRNTDSGVTAEVTVGAIEDLTGDHITDIHLSAAGRGVGPQDLLMLEYLGLRLPGRDVPPAALPSSNGAAALVNPPGELIPTMTPEEAVGLPVHEPKSWAGKKGGRPAPQFQTGVVPSRPANKAAKAVKAVKAVSAPAKAVSTPAPVAKSTPKAAPKTAAKGAAKGSAKSGPKKNAAQAAAGAKGRATRAANAAKGGGRAYRMAPPVEQLQAVMAEHGGATAAAKALGVPLHSVAGWLRRYRDLGHQFPTNGQETLPVETDGGK